VTLQNRYHEDFIDPAEIRTISILRRPPAQRVRRITHVMQDELPKVVTYKRFTIDPTINIYITTKTPTSQETNIQYKDLNHSKSQIRLSMDKIQIRQRVLN
jgi:hypothetical protein